MPGAWLDTTQNQITYTSFTTTIPSFSVTGQQHLDERTVCDVSGCHTYPAGNVTFLINVDSLGVGFPSGFSTTVYRYEENRLLKKFVPLDCLGYPYRHGHVVYHGTNGLGIR